MPPKHSHMVLSCEQQYAFDKYREGGNLFITGPGGSGKSAIIQTIIKDAREREIKYQVCALTGCAAVLLQCKAKTIHSYFGLGLANGEKSVITEKASNKKMVKKNLRGIDLLIVDEVSMLSMKMFECINDIAGLVRRKTSLPFGGLQVIFTGDFYQLPPIGRDNDPGSTNFCFESPEWSNTFPIDNHIELQRIFRQKDEVYLSILNEIRVGSISEKGIEVLNKYVNRPIASTEDNAPVPTKLYPTRAKVDIVNQNRFDQLITPEQVYEYTHTSKCKFYIDNGELIPAPIQKECMKLTAEEMNAEMERTLDNTNFMKTLKLKIGANVMCVYNINVDAGICNGSQGVVIDFVRPKEDVGGGDNVATIKDRLYPKVRFSNGLVMTILPVETQNEEFPCIVVGQIPLRLAWALTIHKSQGATLDMAEIDIGSGIFEAGQSYVALSRVRCLDGLYLSSFVPSKIRANPLVKNFYASIPGLEFVEEEDDDQDQDEDKGHKRVQEDQILEPEPVVTNTDVKRISVNLSKDRNRYAQFMYNDETTF